MITSDGSEMIHKIEVTLIMTHSVNALEIQSDDTSL